MDILDEAENVLQGHQFRLAHAHVHDPQYQRLTSAYYEAVQGRRWHAAHDLLVSINIFIERFHDHIATE